MNDDPRPVTTRCSAGDGTTQDGGTWVFAYGSLMWRPDFLPAAIRAGRLYGWHRAMCVLSTQYRGTPERPGLVLGLDRGGSCVGRVLRVTAEDWPAVKTMLDARELVTNVYTPRLLPVCLDDGTRVAAYAYVVRRDHGQYWRGTAEQAACLIRQGIGPRGTSRAYLADTVAHMSALGMGDGALHRLLRLVETP